MYVGQETDVLFRNQLIPAVLAPGNCRTVPLFHGSDPCADGFYDPGW